jgi:FkbM family methyltransferase
MENLNGSTARQHDWILPEGFTAIDIGAHHGESAVQMLNAGASHVFSVEPCLINYLQLVSCAESHPGRITPIRALAGVRAGEKGEVRYCDFNSGLSSMGDRLKAVYPHVGFSDPEDVEGIDLDTLGDADLLKIDVEGYEWEVIRGITSRRYKVIIFEFHDHTRESTWDCLKHLYRIGYTRGFLVPDDIDYKRHPDVDTDRIIEQMMSSRPPWGNITVL